MGYMIRMGIPEMEQLWNDLQQRYRNGNEIPPLTKRYGMKVWPARQLAQARGALVHGVSPGPAGC